MEEAGYVVDLALNDEAFRSFALSGYDLYILDRHIPQGESLATLRWLRGRGDPAPVLMTATHACASERVAGLDAGADDFIVAPIDAEELRARARALLRRPIALRRLMTYGGLEFDLATQDVRCDGAPLPLRTSERRLLSLLLRRAGRVVTREQIDAALTSASEECSPNAMEQVVSRLRKALAEAPCRVVVRTVRGIGYMLEEARESMRVAS